MKSTNSDPKKRTIRLSILWLVSFMAASIVMQVRRVSYYMENGTFPQINQIYPELVIGLLALAFYFLPLLSAIVRSAKQAELKAVAKIGKFLVIYIVFSIVFVLVYMLLVAFGVLT